MANELIETNPAGEAIDGALPSMPKVKAHLRTLPYQEAGSALKTVDASRTSLAAKRCLTFLVYTAARSGEARGAAWGEIDLESATWTIPASRMKAGVEHRVPLSDQALEVLKLARQLEDGSGLCFPSPQQPGRTLSDMTLTKTLRSTGLAGPDDGARVQNVLQDLDHGTDGCALGGGGGGPGASAGRERRASVRTLRSVRPPPDAHAAVGELPHSLVAP